MESDSWTRLFSASSERLQLSHQSRYDLCLSAEEFDGIDEDSRGEFTCPFCAEDFDFVGLCCHIDEQHPQDVKTGICPICASRVAMDLVGHFTLEHGNLFKVQRRRRFRRGLLGSHSSLSYPRKELRGANEQVAAAAILGGDWPHLSSVPPPPAASDPLLSSFIYALPAAAADTSIDALPESPNGVGVSAGVKDEHDLAVESPKHQIPDQEQEERGRRCDFVRGLLLSTIFEDIFL